MNAHQNRIERSAGGGGGGGFEVVANDRKRGNLRGHRSWGRGPQECETMESYIYWHTLFRSSYYVYIYFVLYCNKIIKKFNLTICNSHCTIQARSTSSHIRNSLSRYVYKARRQSSASASFWHSFAGPSAAHIVTVLSAEISIAKEWPSKKLLRSCTHNNTLFTNR